MKSEDFYRQMLQEGVAAVHAGDLDRAYTVAETLVAERPNDPEAMSLLGAIHFKRGNVGTATTISRMVLNLAAAQGKQCADWWFNVANCLYRTYHKEPAQEAFDKAAAINPTDCDVWESYSGFWLQYADAKLSEEYARKALAIDPNCVNGNSHLGMALLLQDRWQEGWPHMEARKRKESWKRPKYPFLDWKGENCDTLIVHGEQGLGDEIMLLSLVPRLMDRADRVVVECSERLVPLLRRSLGCEVYGSMEEAADNGVFPREWLTAAPDNIDLTAPRITACGSLPAILGVSREDCADNAYLVPDVARAKLWRARLQAVANGRPIVAVAWLGGAYETHKVLRNPPREMFTRLSPEKYCLVSVQYTEGAERLAAKMGMLHFPQAVKDLDEQAALLAACDCLVTVAQTAMHIAGGLGVPTFALINQYPKWDCGREGPSVPWWKSVTAIRQIGDDWTSVFSKLLIELGEEPVTVTDKALRFGALTAGPSSTIDLSHINIGAPDAPQTDLRAAE